MPSAEGALVGGAPISMEGEIHGSCAQGCADGRRDLGGGGRAAGHGAAEPDDPAGGSAGHADHAHHDALRRASATGALAFEANPPDCLSPTGVTTAGIAGTIGLNHN